MATAATLRFPPIRDSYARAAALLATPLFGTHPRNRTRSRGWDQQGRHHGIPASDAYIGYSRAQTRYIILAWQREQRAARVAAQHRRVYEQALASGDSALADALSESIFQADEVWREANQALQTVLTSAGRPKLRTPEQGLRRQRVTPLPLWVRLPLLALVTAYVGVYLLLPVFQLAFVFMR